MTIEQLEEKLTQRPQSPLFAFLAAQYLEREEPERARDLCLSGIDRYPTYATAYYILAQVFAREANFTSAYDSIQRAITLNPTAKNFLEFKTEIESRLEPQQIVPVPFEVPPDAGEAGTIISASASTDSTEILDEDITMEAIEEIPVGAIPGLIESETNDTYEEQTTIQNVPDELVQIQKEYVSTSLEPDQPENIEDISNGNDEVPELPLTAESQHPHVVSEEDSIITAEIQNSTDTIIGDELAQSVSEEILVEDLAPLKEQDNRPEITPEITDSPTSSTDEINTDAPQITEEPRTLEIPKSRQVDEGRIISRTLAEIFASQGEYQEAIITYTLLKEARPHLSDEIDTRIEELEKLQREKTG